MNRKTTNEFKEEVKELVGNEFTVLGEYINCETNILMRHNKCNFEFEIRPQNFLMRKSCPKCSNHIIYTTDNFKKEVKELVGDEYKVLGTYKNSSTKIKFLHTVCNKEFLMTPTNFLHQNKCPHCFGKKKKTTDEFKEEVKELVGNEFTVLGEYINCETNILMRHNKCGETFEIRPQNFLMRKSCPKCRYKNISEKLSMTDSDFKNKVKELVGDEYIILDEYKRSHDHIRILHKKCNGVFYITPNNFLSGYRCPMCSNRNKRSSGEIELLDFIKSFYKGTISESNRDIIPPYELDIYLPNDNIALEFDGLYWHGEKYGKDKNYHLNKTVKCNEIGIHLIHIFEDEWKYKQDIVKSKIKHILGYDQAEKIYARKCYVEPISTSDKNIFLNENHIQGEDTSSIRLGLWYPMNNEDVLVSVMTFCKPRRILGQNQNNSITYDYELSRFCNDINFRVIGGFSKLLSYFINNYDFNSIITYADRRWSYGNVYDNNGFKFLHYSKPNYWYTNYDKRFHRSNFQKHLLKEKFPEIYNENLTEKEIMKNIYDSIYDCGNLVYSYKNNK